MPYRSVETLSMRSARHQLDSGHRQSAYESGTIFTYRVGKQIPALLTCLIGNISGMESFFRPEWRTSLIWSSLTPMKSLNSFMLHGWATVADQHPCRMSRRTFLRLKNWTPVSQEDYFRALCRFTFPKVILSIQKKHCQPQSIQNSGHRSTQLSTERASSRRMIHCFAFPW